MFPPTAPRGQIILGLALAALILADGPSTRAQQPQPAAPDLTPVPAPAPAPAPVPSAENPGAAQVQRIGTPFNRDVPIPIPDVRQRSGLISRFAPIPALLPPDHKRDTFYGTRYGDYYPRRNGPNCLKDGGLYGWPLPADCTASVRPYFWGTPGQSTIGPHCQSPHPWSRWVGNFVHPFRPVGMYYDRGSYVPIYDLDPLVTGPGPFPWPFIKRQHTGG